MNAIAIVGAGIIGAAIAYELSAIADLKIILLDREPPAGGSTGAALGVLMGAISHKTQGRNWRLRHLSLERYETLIPELEAITGEKLDYNRDGILMLRFSEDDRDRWQWLQAKRQAQGWPLELWDRDRVRARCPAIADDRLVGAVYSPRDRQVNPVQLTHSLIAAAQKRGVLCEWDAPVTDAIATTPDSEGLRRCTHLQLGDREIPVDWVILTAGIGSTPLTTALGQSVDIRPVLGQALQIHLESPLPSTDFHPVITGRDVHIVPLSNGDYWLGATVEFANTDGEIVPQASLLETVKQEAFRYCPALASGEVIRTWSGLRPRPEGRAAPIIETLPGYGNVILASGHYRNGILLAPATALAVRDRLEQGPASP
jgi:glycine oxidase